MWLCRLVKVPSAKDMNALVEHVRFFGIPKVRVCQRFQDPLNESNFNEKLDQFSITYSFLQIFYIFSRFGLF